MGGAQRRDKGSTFREICVSSSFLLVGVQCLKHFLQQNNYAATRHIQQVFSLKCASQTARKLFHATEALRRYESLVHM